MYRHLGQDSQAEMLMNLGLVDTSTATGGIIPSSTELIAPSASVPSSSSLQAIISSLPATTVNPVELAPGVYVNPQAVTQGTQLVQTASGALQLVQQPATAAATTAAGVSTLDYWLAQSTGGVKNSYLFYGGLLFGGALLVITTLKKKR